MAACEGGQAVAEECPQHQRDPAQQGHEDGAAPGAKSIGRHDPDLAQPAQREVVADQFEFEFGRIVRGTRGVASESLFADF